MKVWIIEFKDWEDSGIMGVYSSEEKAKKELEKIESEKTFFYYDCCDIDEYEVE